MDCFSSDEGMSALVFGTRCIDVDVGVDVDVDVEIDLLRLSNVCDWCIILPDTTVVTEFQLLGC
jgi:hypothetical protein